MPTLFIGLKVKGFDPSMGNAVPCVAHHRDNNEGVPGCFFSKEAEATYDRSIENLARDHGIL